MLFYLFLVSRKAFLSTNSLQPLSHLLAQIEDVRDAIVYVSWTRLTSTSPAVLLCQLTSLLLAIVLAAYCTFWSVDPRMSLGLCFGVSVFRCFWLPMAKSWPLNAKMWLFSLLLFIYLFSYYVYYISLCSSAYYYCCFYNNYYYCTVVVCDCGNANAFLGKTPKPINFSWMVSLLCFGIVFFHSIVLLLLLQFLI